MTLCYYFLWFLFYSLFGWVYESIYCSIQARKLVNRGFLNGPICPIYGAGALLFLVTLQWIQNPFLIFLAGMLLASILEYVTSWVLEKLFHARWWDYTNFKFNINGRICLLGGIVFGAFAVVLIKWVHPLVLEVTMRISDTTIIVATIFFAAIILADCFFTFGHLLQFTHKLTEIQTAINAFFREFRGSRNQASTFLTSLSEKFENSQAYNERIGTLLHTRTYQEKRILKAFPKAKSELFEDALQKVKQLLHPENLSQKKKRSK